MIFSINENFVKTWPENFVGDRRRTLIKILSPVQEMPELPLHKPWSLYKVCRSCFMLVSVMGVGSIFSLGAEGAAVL